MPSPFEVELSNQQNVVTAGELAFVDPANQPADAGPGGGPGSPYTPTAGNDTTVLQTSDGHALIKGGDDRAGVMLSSADGTHTLQITNSGATVDGEFNANSLGPEIPYVTVQATPPAGPYQTPLVLDTTAVTGGLYAWDGAAYQQVAGPLS